MDSIIRNVGIHYEIKIEPQKLSPLSMALNEDNNGVLYYDIIGYLLDLVDSRLRTWRTKEENMTLVKGEKRNAINNAWTHWAAAPSVTLLAGTQTKWCDAMSISFPRHIFFFLFYLHWNCYRIDFHLIQNCALDLNAWAMSECSFWICSADYIAGRKSQCLRTNEAM